MKKIAIEEHFYTQDYVNYLASKNYWKPPELQNQRGPYVPGDTKRLIDIEGERMQKMDKAGINMQVLSLSVPGVEDWDEPDAINWARKTNDELSQVAKKHPDRFAGFAALPISYPKAAAEELERAVKVLGLKGAKVQSHAKGEFFDDRKYWAVFKKAQSLNVPIYLHPREPAPDMITPYLAFKGLEGAMAGFGAGTSLHALRLILSGLFDEYPRLKIILGHLGEALPFWQWRLDNMWPRKPNPNNIKRKISEYLKDNFYFTTSGMFSVPSLMCVYMISGADNILFAVDYPMEIIEQAVSFMEAAPICDSDKEKIYHLNAEKLLKL